MFQGRPVDPMVLSSVGRFFFLFMMVFVCATILITGTGLEPFDAMSAVATTLGNVGPGFGIVGPMVNFASVSLFAKVVFTACMLLGRLELFTILVLTQPEFWRNYKS
jgi:trk system potassium uptake protein TrkH